MMRDTAKCGIAMMDIAIDFHNPIKRARFVENPSRTPLEKMCFSESILVGNRDGGYRIARPGKLST
jgi:hypothetical protein